MPYSSALDSPSVMSKFATSPPARNLDMLPVLDDAYDATARDAMLDSMPDTTRDDTMLDTARDTMLILLELLPMLVMLVILPILLR